MRTPECWWRDALDELDAGAPAALPGPVRCPACGQPARAEPDRGGRTAWLTCPACGDAGNIVELAARRWNTDLAAAAGLLAGRRPDAAGLAALARDDLADALARRGALAALDPARSRALAEKDDDRLLGRLTALGLAEGGAWPAWLDGLAGACRGEDLQPHLSGWYGPDGRHLTHRPKGGCLAVPAFAGPGRLAGLWCLFGRTGKGAYAALRPPAAEATLLLAAPPAADPDFGNRLFVLAAAGADGGPDPRPALLLRRLEARAGARGGPPLPVCAPGPGPVGPAPLGGRPAVCWSARLDGGLVGLCRRLEAAGADAADVPFDPTALHHHSARAWLARCAKAARPWPELLAEIAVRQGATAAVAAAGQAGLTAAEYAERVRPLLGPAPRGGLDRALLGPATPAKLVYLGNGRYEERGGRWYKNGRLYADHPLRLDAVVATEEGAYYRGRVLHEGGAAPFFVKAEAAEFNGHDWVRRALLAAGQSPGHVPHQRQAPLLSLARRFQETPPVETAEPLWPGWHEASGRFGLPGGLSLNLRGEIAAVAATAAPPPLRPAEIDLLARGDFRPWPLLAALAAQVLAPLQGTPAPNVALVGPGAYSLALQAVRLGARGARAALATARVGTAAACALAEAARGRWPVAADLPAGRPALGVLAAPEARGVLLPLSPFEVWALRCREPWAHLRALRLRPGALAPEGHLARLLPDFLAWLARQGRLDLYRQGGRRPPLEQAGRLVADWLFETAGLTVRVSPKPRVDRLGRAGSARRAEAAFARLLSLMVRKGLVPDGAFAVRRREAVLGPQALQTALQGLGSRGRFQPPWGLVKKALLKRGVLLRAEGRQGTERWWLRRPWWDKVVWQGGDGGVRQLVS
jgi:hypothetical protein